MSDRIFGHIPGYPEGSRFESRTELSDAGVHRPTIAGISGSAREGADSIVLSGATRTTGISAKDKMDVNTDEWLPYSASFQCRP
jgi:hypothetical protein